MLMFEIKFLVRKFEGYIHEKLKSSTFKVENIGVSQDTGNRTVKQCTWST